MTEIQLENTLFDFIEGQYDVLVTTTIIETGVDIPNANTLFVENADYMGFRRCISCAAVSDGAIESPMRISCMNSKSVERSQ